MNNLSALKMTIDVIDKYMQLHNKEKWRLENFENASPMTATVKEWTKTGKEKIHNLSFVLTPEDITILNEKGKSFIKKDEIPEYRKIVALFY